MNEQDPILGIFGHKKVSKKLGPIPAWEANMVKTYLRKQNVDEQSYDDYEELMDSLFDGVPLHIRFKGVTDEQRLEGVSVEKRLKGIPEEKRLEGISEEKRLKGISEEKRLKGISEEKRLKGISAKKRLEGIPTKERLSDLPEEEQILALSDAVLANLPEDYILSLPKQTQEKIRRRLNQ